MHRIGGDAHGEVARPQLQERRLDAEIGRACIDPGPDLPQPAFHQRELRSQVGHHELDALELEDATPGLLALVDVGHGILECGPRDAERMRRHAGTRLVQRGEEDLQAVARLPQQVGARHAAVVESDRGGAGRARSHLVLEPDYGQAARAFFQHEHRDAFLRTGNAFPLAEHQVQVRDVAVGDEGLAAVDDDVVAILAERRAHAGGVGAGVRLGDGERGQSAFRDARHQPLLLLLGAPIDEGFHRVVIGGPADSRGRARLADLAHTGEIGGIRHR